MKKIKVWDLPTRLFHWSLVVAVITCFYSIKQQNITLHQYAGLFVLVLTVFRVLWGFIGASTARFWDFLRGPVTIYRYMRYEITPTEGHNPMGGYMVLLFFILLLSQTITGLFLGDNTYMHQDSPLYKLVGNDTRSIIKTIHFYSEYVFYAVIGLHLLAIFVYFVLKGQNLVKSMVVGKRSEQELHTALAENIKHDHPFFGLIVFLIIATILPYFLYGYMNNLSFFAWLNNLITGIKGLF